MQVSLNWLSDHIDISDISVERLCETFTMLGLEIESSEKIEGYKGSVVVGRILEAIPHPDADKLQICKVDVGDNAEEPLTIVCGAPNAREGIMVATALVGATLPGDFKIKLGKIRGQKSAGMLCSGKELGISEEDDGIVELDAQLEVGKEIKDVFPLSDTVLTISITPNRADCLSYIGVARDLAAKLNRPMKAPYENISINEAVQSKIELNIEDESDCPNLGVIGISGLKVTPSPLWVQKRLENSGIRPINLLVDVSNYVMLEQGHPIHAYDAQRVAGRTIGVRRAKNGEIIETLDQQKRSLCENDLVITDGEKIIGLAGVMGGANSEVTETTTEVIVEVAQFNPTLIRKTAKRFALHSEASHRFERGVDGSRIKEVASRYYELLRQITDELKKSNKSLPEPQVVCHAKIIGSPPAKPLRIALRLDRLKKVSGFPILSQKECIDYLSRLGLKLIDQAADRMLFEIPSWRLDLTREVDLIEEVVRLHGIDKITPTFPMMEIGTLPEPGHIGFQDSIKRQLALLGFNETISFPFIGEQELQNHRIPKDHPYHMTVSLENPLVENHRYLRTSLIFSLLNALVLNRRHGVQGSRLFENGRVFFRPIDERAVNLDHYDSNLLETKSQGLHMATHAREEKVRPIERNVIAAVLDSTFSPAHWDKAEESTDFFHAKSVVSAILEDFGISSDVSFKRPLKEALPFLHPGASAVVSYQNMTIGYLGSLHPETASAYDFDFRKPPVVLELDTDVLWELQKQKRDYESVVNRFPPVSRDIAILVNSEISHDDVVLATKQFNRQKHLKGITLFDVYQDEQMGKTKKSLAYHLTFQATKKTLTDAEVDKELQALLSWYREQLSAELR